MQTSSNLLLVRPANFIFNKQTAKSNHFQNSLKGKPDLIQAKAFQEFENFKNILISKGVNVYVFDDTPFPQKPDAVFPNNWVSFHSDGRIILYPMCAPNRRAERRSDIIDEIKKQFKVKSILDLSSYEISNKFLEGTGSIIFDHIAKKAYACLSPRTDKTLLLKVCEYLGYEAIYFHSLDASNKEIYHTNVMMCIGRKFAVICLESIKDKKERLMVSNSLKKDGHQIIDISLKQVKQFAGNMLEIKGSKNKALLAMSKSAYNSLTKGQIKKLENYTTLLPLPIKTIETIGGGSARCMIAEIFLKKIG